MGVRNFSRRIESTQKNLAYDAIIVQKQHTNNFRLRRYDFINDNRKHLTLSINDSRKHRYDFINARYGRRS